MRGFVAVCLGLIVGACGRSERAVELSEEPTPSVVEPQAPQPPSEPGATAGVGVVVRTETVPCEVASETLATFSDGRAGFYRWYQAKFDAGDSWIAASAHYTTRLTLGEPTPQVDPCTAFDNMGEHSCTGTTQQASTEETSVSVVPSRNGLLTVGCGSEYGFPEYTLGDVMVPPSEHGLRADTVAFRIVSIAN